MVAPAPSARGRTARRATAALAVACALIASFDRARAVTVSGSDTLFVRIVADRNLANDTSTTRLPTFDFLTLDVEDFGVTGLSFRGAGWGRWDSLGKEGGDIADADLSYGFLNYRSDGAFRAVRAGRQFLSMGVARDWIDGAVVQSSEIAGLGIAGFAGTPVVSQVGNKSGDYLWGGRLHWRQKDSVEFGVSYVGSRENDDTDRQQVGLDAYVSPARWLDFEATGGYDTISEHVFDIETLAHSDINGWLDLFAGYDYTRPSDFLSKASIFSVFADDHVRQFSGGAAVSPAEWVTLRLDVTHSSYDGSGGERIGSTSVDANRYGGDVRLHPDGPSDGWLSAGDGFFFGFGAWRTDGLQGESTLVASDFTELRGYLSYDLTKTLTLAPDVVLFLYDRAIESESESVSVSGSLYYACSPDLDLDGTVTWSTNPVFENEVEGLVRARWRFSATFFE